jgi:hypothetical protein
VHELTDGRLVATERDCHPDSIAEAFRRRITVLELQQIIGAASGAPPTTRCTCWC